MTTASPTFKKTAMDDETALWLDHFTSYPRLTAAEERDLGRRVQCGDTAARESLVVHNMRLVVHIAQRYARYEGMTLMDLVQEGTIGLLKAIDQYQPDAHPNNRFGTFAGWLIQQACGRALAERSGIVRIPTYLWALRAKVWAVEAQSADDGDLTDAEIAAALGVSERRVHLARTACDTVETIDYPLHSDHSDRERTAVIEILQSDDAVEEQVLHALDRDDLHRALGSLSARERIVICLRYGIAYEAFEFDGEPLTTKAIGARLGVSRETVRTLERDALTKLRRFLEHPPTAAAKGTASSAADATDNDTAANDANDNTPLSNIA